VQKITIKTVIVNVIGSAYSDQSQYTLYITTTADIPPALWYLTSEPNGTMAYGT